MQILHGRCVSGVYMRLIMSKRLRRVLKPHLAPRAALELGPFPPGPSRLRRSYMHGEEDEDADEWDDTASVSSSSTVAYEGQGMAPESESGVFVDEFGSLGLLSAAFARVNASQIFETSKKDVASYVEGPFLVAEAERSTESVGSTISHDSVSDNKHDQGKKDENMDCKTPKTRRTAFAGWRKLPGISRHLHLGLLLHRAADTSWRRMRTFGTSLLKVKVK